MHAHTKNTNGDWGRGGKGKEVVSLNFPNDRILSCWQPWTSLSGKLHKSLCQRIQVNHFLAVLSSEYTILVENVFSLQMNSH